MPRELVPPELRKASTMQLRRELSEPPIHLTRRAPPDELSEWMDEPCAYEDFRACLVDLGQVNRLSLGYRPTINFLDRLIARGPIDEPLHIVDVGFGGGDMLRRVAAWAERRKLKVTLTGIDLNPHAARAARESSPPDCHIHWITGDAFSTDTPRPIDVVLSSLFTHHLGEAEIVRFLAWMESSARLGWCINDLCRERLPLHLFALLGKVARWHRFVQHDGPVSFRRAFREDDWERMLAAAAIAPGAVSLARWTPARLCVTRFK